MALVGIARLAAHSELLKAKRTVQYFEIPARSILNRTRPNMPFQWTINPYRGCEFGCKYCYARYTHEFMEMEPEDFEDKIYVKSAAAHLLRQELGKVDRKDHIAIGTATDPYQPAERRYERTRGILEVFARDRGRFLGIITKSDLVLRDLDLLKEISRRNVLMVTVTVTTVDEKLARLLEPRAPRPELRLDAVRKLRGAGICTGVNPNPIMPGITDSERALDGLARAAHRVGALSFGGGALYLPTAAQKVFLPFLDREFPALAGRYRQAFARGIYLSKAYKETLGSRVQRIRDRYGLASGFIEYRPEFWAEDEQMEMFRYSEGCMNLADFDYQLPQELIAQQALADRSGARMLVLDRGRGQWEDRWFREFPCFLREGDCVVLNDSRVFPARLFGHRPGKHSGTPRAVEVLLLRAASPDGRDWQALVRPGRAMAVGERIAFEGGLEAQIVARGEFGQRTVRFHGDSDLFQAFERIGHVPLPPYIKRPDEPSDRERYQTVFAREKGSAAAPTAGLHFTEEVLTQCRERGAALAYVTLHVGLGTFQPLREATVECSKLHAETYRITEENAARIRAAGRVVAVGTTSVRCIESAWRRGEFAGETDIFLYPGVPFQITGAMLTNFHLPRTSLLLLIAAFAGREFALAAYRHAVESRYRFYSYGDCMLIL